ncbi:MAG: pyridoxal phosphate-dependent aminotransferase [Bifidobacteriaceae bacterium]|nr:pyridoxal phosphate-dependent aminotransferase [Bifidobacteriaceae bacterium]
MRRSVFDEVINRSGTGALMLARERYGVPADALPLWVADMAFRTPPTVTEALAERVRHGIFGYSLPTPAYYDALAGWFERRHAWELDPRTAVLTRGVVHGLYLTLEALTAPGAGVIIQPPVYPPFFEVVRDTGRRVLANPLVEDAGRYVIDFDHFEALARDASAFILCSPHNPVGRVWTRSELSRLAEICLRHDVWIISDEVHQDFVYPGGRHVVTATLDPAVAARTVTCTAPSKTFNLAGLQLANLLVSDPAARARLTATYGAQGLSQQPVVGLLACQAAYGGGADAWVDELVAYLAGNLALIEAGVADLPGLRFTRPEGTYLAWLDLRGLDLEPAPLRRLVLEGARLWLSDGPTFGAEGAGFQRLNAAVPRSVIESALERLAAAVP